MAIKFCPKCGSMMKPQKDDNGSKLVCRKCEYVEKIKDKKDVVVKEVVQKKSEIPVFDDEKNKENLSTIKVKCHKCGNDEAMWWLQQTRSGDEPSTRFFKCISCGHTWREYA